LTSQYEKIVSVIPKYAKGRKPQGFPQFTKLPKELQLKIWRFAALLPRVITLGMAPCKRFGRKKRYYREKIIDYSGVHPLLITNFTSRQIALETIGDGYSVDRVYSNTDDPDIRTCYTIRYNPRNDTIFAWDVTSLDTLSRCYHICPKARPLSSAGLTVVRSLALRHLWLPTDLGMAYNESSRHLRRFWSVSRFITSTIDFTALEEFILVDPIIAKETTSRNFKGKQKPKLVPIGKAEQKEQLNNLLDFLSRQLKEAMQRSGNRRYSVIRTAISSWWENPKIIVMTEEQFKARFNPS
jgi:hypothetical protein